MTPASRPSAPPEPYHRNLAIGLGAIAGELVRLRVDPPPRRLELPAGQRLRAHVDPPAIVEPDRGLGVGGQIVEPPGMSRRPGEGRDDEPRVVALGEVTQDCLARLARLCSRRLEQERLDA